MRHTPGTPRMRPCPDHWLGTDPWYGTVDLGLGEAPWRPPDPPPRGAPSGRRPPLRLTRRGRRVLAGGLAVVCASGLFLVTDGLRGGDGPPQPAAAAAPASRLPVPGASGRRPTSSATAPLPALGWSPPTRIRIPSLGVDAPLTRVGLNAKGEIDTPPPQEKNLAGWYQSSAAPGAAGTSVIVGHVDNTSGPAVFFGLGALGKGRLIEVPRQDGTTAVFSVYGVEVFPRDDFPAARVYSGTGHVELRVITCGGRYTKEAGYTGNIVVFARLARAA
jgi:hypothetical protein